MDRSPWKITIGLDCCRTRISQAAPYAVLQWPLLDAGYHHRFYMHTILLATRPGAGVGVHVEYSVVFRQGTLSPVTPTEERAGGHRYSYISYSFELRESYSGIFILVRKQIASTLFSKIIILENPIGTDCGRTRISEGTICSTPVTTTGHWPRQGYHHIDPTAILPGAELAPVPPPARRARPPPARR